MMLSRYASPVAAAFAALMIALGAGGALAAPTIQRLSPTGGLGNVELKHLKANADGDYVAVSNTLVYVGNSAGGAPQQLLSEPDAGFSLSGTAVVTITGSSTTTQVRVDAELFDTRVDLNANGDFIVASNTRLWIGNVRTKAAHQVADAGAGTEFQDVRINDAGQYVAMSGTKLFAGNITAAAATQVLADAAGNFAIYAVQAVGTNADVHRRRAPPGAQ